MPEYQKDRRTCVPVDKKLSMLISTYVLWRTNVHAGALTCRCWRARVHACVGLISLLCSCSRTTKQTAKRQNYKQTNKQTTMLFTSLDCLFRYTVTWSNECLDVRLSSWLHERSNVWVYAHLRGCMNERTNERTFGCTFIFMVAWTNERTFGCTFIDACLPTCLHVRLFAVSMKASYITKSIDTQAIVETFTTMTQIYFAKKANSWVSNCWMICVCDEQ